MSELPTPEVRPWGNFQRLFTNIGEASVSAKILTVNPHSRLSLQYHQKRSERWTVINGIAEVQIEKNYYRLLPGATADIPIGTAHRLGSKDSITQVLEVSIGYLDENDIVRLEDDFGRVNQP
jgi:mannose-6-phosphate isomerase-like protein (cupin superfamily)